jgi:hypothetical protein
VTKLGTLAVIAKAAASPDWAVFHAELTIECTKCRYAMIVFHHLARVMFRFVIRYRYYVGRVRLHRIQNFVQVMFRPKISTDKTYVECKYKSLITSIGIIQALFVSDRLYVKCQNTSCFGWSNSSL